LLFPKGNNFLPVSPFIAWLTPKGIPGAADNTRDKIRHEILVAEIGDRKIIMIKKYILLLPIVALCLLTATLLHADTRKSVRTVPPVYPAIAAKMRIEGTVKLDVTIAPDGSVGDIKVVIGHTLLAPTAIDAVKKWRYEPGEGKSTQSVSVEFNLPH
jgi:TonB family protein